MYVRELSVYYRLRRIRGSPIPDGIVATPSASAAMFSTLLGHEVVEVCGVVCLSSRLEVLAYHELARGTLDRTIVQPRDIFRTALLANAGSVLVGHNHPSGDPAPSPDDIELTRRVVAAGTLMGIAVLDHVIVAPANRYFSFKESGQL